MKILVTGCAGYIGSTLMDMLSQNQDYQITGVDNFIYNNQYAVQGVMNRPNVKILKGDYTESGLNHDVIVHLAALVGASICNKYKETAKRTNFESVKRLLDSKAKIIFMNTNSGYGIGGEEKCTEESPLTPLSLYGETKCKAEELILNRGNSVSLRLATVFGMSARMRMDLMVNNFAYYLFFHNKLEIFEPKFRRNFVGVKDVARAIMWSFGLDGVYNVGLDEANCNKLELANQLKYLVNPKSTVLIGTGTDPDKRDYIVSSEKLMLTGFKFNQKLDSITKVVDWFRLVGYTALNHKNDYI